MIQKPKLPKGWRRVCCAELSRSKGPVSGKHSMSKGMKEGCCGRSLMKVVGEVGPWEEVRWKRRRGRAF